MQLLTHSGFDKTVGINLVAIKFIGFQTVKTNLPRNLFGGLGDPGRQGKAGRHKRGTAGLALHLDAKHLIHLH